MLYGALSTNLFLKQILESIIAEKTKAGYFDHEKWDVYRAALEFIILVKDVVEKLPRGNTCLTDQLQRAATSIPLNIVRMVESILLMKKRDFIVWPSNQLQSVQAFSMYAKHCN